MGKVFKRLLVFLTVFLTGPAFAGVISGIGNNYNNTNSGFIGFDSSTPPQAYTQADCDAIPLTYNGTAYDSGTYYLTARYEQDAYDVYYYRGTCEGDGNPSKYNDVGHYGPTDGYTILPASTSSASQPHGISAPNNMHFVNWSAYWVDKEVCEEGGGSVRGAYLQSKSSVFPAGHYNAANDTADNDNSWNPGSFNWYDTNKNCLLLVGNCVADDSYTVTYKNGTCDAGTEIEWTDSTQTYFNGTYYIPSATDTKYTSITAVYSEGNDKEFTGWKLVWATYGAENNTKDYGDSITWTRAENLVLEAQCRDTYKLEYSCGVDPDTGSTIGGTAPSTRTGIHVEDSDVTTEAAPTQCNNGLLEFDHWRCVKKDHDNGSDAGVFGTDGKFGAGVSLTNSWPAYDGLCTAVWNNPVLTCPSSHQEHDVEVITSYTQCYRITTTDSCDKLGEATATQDDHCIYAADCSCEMVTYRVYANEQGNADSDVIKSEDGTQVLSSVPAPYCTREIVAGAQPIGAESGYSEYDPQTGTCEAIPTYPVIYDCDNNGLGTDGNGTNPTDADSPYAANASVNVLEYPAQCQAPTERIADATLGWECVAQDGTLMYSGSGNDNFVMPAQPVTCTAKWKSTAYNITYIGCKCNTSNITLPDNCNVDPDKGEVVGQDITNKVVSGELVSNDKRTYYRTYHRGRHVNFPTTVGTNYGQVNVANGAFNSGNNNAPWFIFYPNEYTTRPVTNNSTSQLNVDGTGDITVYTCLAAKYQIIYNCKEGTGGPYTDGPLDEGNYPTRDSEACSRPGWTFYWDCGTGYNKVTPGDTIRVNEDKECNAVWNCANGYEYDSATGQCIRKYNLTFNCANGNYPSQNPIKQLKLKSGETYNIEEHQSELQCTTKSCSEAVDKDTWICKKDNNGQPVSVGDDGVLTMPAADVTCTAQWTPTTKTVTYNSGNCNNLGIVHTETVNCGSSASQSGTAQNNLGLTGSSMTFVGWTTDSTPTVAANGSVANPWSGGSVTNDITVYAACKPTQYELRLHCSSGSTDSKKSYNAGTNVSLGEDEYSDVCGNNTGGKEFTGWTCSPSNSYADNIVTMNSNVDCYAQVNQKYHLTYNCANGKSDENPVDPGETHGWYSAGDAVTTFTDTNPDTCQTPPLEGMEFDGWNCPDTNRSGTTGDMAMPGHNVECTAKWTGRDFKVTYDCNGTTVTGGHVKNGTSATEMHSGIKFGEDEFEFKTVDKICEFEHHNPADWVCVTDDSDKTDITRTINFGRSETWNRAYDVLCTTDWTDEKYELEYVCNNNGKSPDHTEQHAYDDSITGLDSQKDCVVPSDTQEFDYYECVPTQGSLISPQYNDADKIVSFNMPDTKVTCTAHWKNKKYSVTYNCTDGTVKDGERPGTRGTVTEDSKTEIIEGITYNEDRFTFTKVDDECELAGHTATGWNCNTTLTNTDYTGSNKWSRKFDVVCNAQWQVKEFELIYDCNNKSAGGTAPVGGTHAVGEQNVKVESGKGSCKAPKGQHFVRWICESLQTDDITGYYDDAQTKIEYFTMPEHNVLCKGKWEDSTENINYVGCVGGDCVIRCDNSGNCTSVSLYSQCSEILNLNDYVDSDKLTYSNTNMVTFPIYNENPTNDLESQGYNFDGNWCKPDNRIACQTISNTSLQSGPLTVCTILEPYYRVTYDCDWIYTAPVDDTRYKSGQDVSVKTGSDCGAGVRPGYTFTKWSCQPEGGTAFDRNSGQGFQIEANTKCTAQWSKKKYKVTYDCTEQSKKPGATMQYNVNYDEEHSVASVDEKCSYDGYTFNGWVCKKVKAGDVLGTYRCPASQASDPSCKDSPIRWDFDDNLKCDALWDENHYDVIYDKGQCGDTTGTVYTDSRGAATGKTYTVPDVATTLMNDAMKTGYTFKGWNTVSGQTEGNWTGESPWTRTSNLTVYAACEANKYDVIYNKENCVKDNGDSYVHKNGATYGERYNAFAGGSSNAKPYIYAETGYTFRGWSTEQNLTDEDFNENGTLKNRWTGENPWERTSSLNVYAVCTPNTYNIRYRNNTCGEAPGLGNIHSDEVKFDENYTLKSLPIEWTTGTNNTVERSIYVPDGYKFIGWKSLTTLAEPDYQDGYTFEPWNRTETLELFAECVEEDYHVTYDCDTLDNPYDSSNSCDADDPTGCRTPVDNTPYHINNTVPVPLNEANTCKKTGYHFDKWSCVADDDNHTELPISQNTNRFEMLAANAKCTAQWIEDEYHVFYNCDSGTSCNNGDTTGCRTPEDNTAYHYDEDVITSDNQLNGQDACVKIGHYPTLWTCDGGYKTEEVVPGNDFEDIRQDTTCTMQWEPYKYDVTYKAGTCGGTENVFRQSAVYGKTFEIKNITDTDMGNLYIQTGYEFLGWSKSPVNEDDVEADGFAVDYVARDVSDMVEDNVTLYAVCKKKIYNVCYDFTVKGGQWDTNDRREPLYEFDIDTIDVGVPLAGHDDKDEAPYYVFDGWYDNSEGIGNAVTSLPGNGLRTNPPTSSVLVERTDRISAQWDEDGVANCDVMLYAKWKPAGKIKFDCLAGWVETHKEPEGVDVLTAEADFCDLGNCDFSLWHCGDYTGSRLDYRPYVDEEDEDYIKVLVPNTTVTCIPAKDCSNLEYNIEYRVYKNGSRQNRVIYDEQEINVNELRPNTYRPGDEPVEYPEVSWANCEFRGWYDNIDFAGEPVTHTPALAIDEEGEDIVLYGNLVCEDDTTLCNEPGHAHWLHIGDGEYDKVCLYEKRPTNQTPAVRVSRSDKNAEPYYMMLSLDSDKKIHDGSEKKMHIVHPDGNVYNVCDKSTCPELAN